MLRIIKKRISLKNSCKSQACCCCCWFFLKTSSMHFLDILIDILDFLKEYEQFFEV